MLHVMLDLETLSTRLPDAAIASIGAILFDPSSDELADNPMFQQSVVLASNAHRHIDGGTVAWWLRQSEPARNALLTDPVPLPFALRQFNTWLMQHRPQIIWANSPSFDCTITRHAFEQHDLRWPFNYWDERDLRTLKDIAYPNNDAPKIRIGAAHGALGDAVSQAAIVQACMRRITLT